MSLGAGQCKGLRRLRLRLPELFEVLRRQRDHRARAWALMIQAWYR